MKELSIEEKAKRYDEALERANTIYNGEYKPERAALTAEILQTVFPELAESRDEKIRNKLIAFINDVWTREDLPPFLMEDDKNDILAWLEKQGEQKSADKVEPKFKIGDWINDGIRNAVIISVNNSIYTAVTDSGDKFFPSYKDIENYHLWTIEDAKDGDVLMGNAPFIFNGNLEGGIGCPGAHCGINTLGKFQIPTDKKHWTGHITTPATKEQRDTLMKAMADAGYTFDFEKKELKKQQKKD